MTTDGDLPATPRSRIAWGPILVGLIGVLVVAGAAALIYPATQPLSDTYDPPNRRTLGTAGAPGMAPDASASASTSASASPSPSASGSSTPTPSGAPSPNGTPPRPAARPGGRPNAGNTGVPAGTTLTAVNGDQTYATAGQVIDRMDIRGYVRITARNVTIRNSIVRGGPSRCSAAVITIVPGASATIEDTEINPTNPNACLDGIWATGATLTRLNIHDTVDGVRAGNDVIVQDSWIHDLRHFTSGSPTGGATETDAVQTIGARRVTLRNNVLNPGARGNAAYQVSQDNGPSGDLRVENNYLDGGHCTLNFSHRGSTTDLTGITVSGNRFGRNTTYVCPILLSTRTTLSRNTGNVWEDTSAPIPPPDRHD